MSKRINVKGDQNIIIKDVKGGTISVNVNGEVQHIRNDLAALKELLEKLQIQQIEVDKKVYDTDKIGQAEFNTIINQYLQESKRNRYLIWLMLVIVFLLAVAFSYAWYCTQVLSKPLNLSVRVDNCTRNQELPQGEAKITLIYGDKVETLSDMEEVIFKGIPASCFHNQKVRVKCEVAGFYPLDTSIVLEDKDKLLLLPIYRDQSFAEITGNVTLNTSSNEIIPLAGVDVEVQGVHRFTDANGNFSLSIPFDKQRTEQRVIFRKKGYKTWDETVPVIANEQMRITLTPL